jgi:hypothetical protein
MPNKKSPAQLDREVAEALAKKTGPQKTETTYRAFTVITYPKGYRGLSKSRWYRTASPMTWTDARDRLVAAGVLDLDLAGRTSEPGGWMLSVDPASYSEARAVPLP